MGCLFQKGPNGVSPVSIGLATNPGRLAMGCINVNSDPELAG